MNVYMKRRTDQTAQQWCSYTVASEQPSPTLYTTFTFARGPFSNMAECQAWIATQNAVLGQEWSC